MAEERQKRLLIKEYDLVCDLTDCKYCEEKDLCSEKDTMTRQDAIERMAKAMAADDVLVEGYYEMAEKALNALLEVEK